MVHDLCDVDVFSSYDTVKLSLFEPEEALKVTHGHDSETDQETLEVTVMGYDPLLADFVADVGEIVRIGVTPPCVSVCVSVSPSPDTVMLQVLDDVDVFSL